MISRRRFLRHLSLTAPGLLSLGLLPEQLYALVSDKPQSRRPLRIGGRVSSAGRGLAGVVVSDGYEVVRTDANGGWEMNSGTDRPFVFISLPAGHRIPVQPNGSAAFFRRIDGVQPRQRYDFALQPLENSDSRHRFLVLADPQIQNAYEVGQLHQTTVPDVQALLKSWTDSEPVHAIGCGDLVFDDLELFEDYNRAVTAMGIPFFQVVGNHDLDAGQRSDELTTQTFGRHYGPAWYSFNRGEIHYVVLDNVFSLGSGSQYIGYLSEAQLSWLEKDLAWVPKGSTVVVSLHIPCITGAPKRYPSGNYISGTVSNRAQLYRLLEPFNAHIMSGHTHFNDNIPARGVYEHCHGTVCGAWWSGPICHDGTPGGYGVYEISGSQLSWQYKSTGHALMHQMRLYVPGGHPDYPEWACANIWNWDPAWEVTWWEDGIRQGNPLRLTARDPLSIKLHSGPQLPARRPWVEPQLTDHIFFFQPSGKAREVSVQARDPFGRVYREILPAAAS